MIGNSPEHWLGDLRQEDYVMQFSLFTNESSAGNMGTYYTNLTALYDECTLAVTGMTFIRMHREWEYLLRDSAEGVWQYILQYRVLVEKQS